MVSMANLLDEEDPPAEQVDLSPSSTLIHNLTSGTTSHVDVLARSAIMSISIPPDDSDHSENQQKTSKKQLTRALTMTGQTDVAEAADDLKNGKGTGRKRPNSTIGKGNSTKRAKLNDHSGYKKNRNVLPDEGNLPTPKVAQKKNKKNNKSNTRKKPAAPTKRGLDGTSAATKDDFKISVGVYYAHLASRGFIYRGRYSMLEHEMTTMGSLYVTAASNIGWNTTEDVSGKILIDEPSEDAAGPNTSHGGCVVNQPDPVFSIADASSLKAFVRAKKDAYAAGHSDSIMDIAAKKIRALNVVLCWKDDVQQVTAILRSDGFNVV